MSGNPASYTAESDAITLNNPTRTGDKFAGWTGTNLDAATQAVTIPKSSTGNRSYVATWTSLASFGWTESYNADGSEERPYVISGNDGWNLLCEVLQDNGTWDRFEGKHIRLDEDITVTAMAGSGYHDFKGTLDGNGHKLTLDYETTAENAAPFVFV